MQLNHAMALCASTPPVAVVYEYSLAFMGPYSMQSDLLAGPAAPGKVLVFTLGTMQHPPPLLPLPAPYPQTADCPPPPPAPPIVTCSSVTQWHRVLPTPSGSRV